MDFLNLLQNKIWIFPIFEFKSFLFGENAKYFGLDYQEIKQNISKE